MDDIASILAASGAEKTDEIVEGVLLDEPWVTSGSSFEDHLDLLVHQDDGTVVRVRVVGSNAVTVAGRVDRGDRVRGRVQRRRDDEGVVIVDSLLPV